MNIFIQESWIDATRNMNIGESDVCETFTDNVGELYRSLMKEHGRCIGRVYIDDKEGKVKSIGWVFQKRKKYEDCDETFLAETWVTLHDSKPKRTVEYKYHELSGGGR